MAVDSTEVTREPATGPAPLPPIRRSVRVAAMATYAVALVAWSLALGLPNDTVQIFGWLWLATIAWNVHAPWRYHLNFLRDWSLPMIGLIVYFFTRGLTDEIGLPVSFQFPIDVDRWMGGGVTPTERLQDAWCGDPCLRASPPRWYDVALTTVYSSHFATGLTIAAVLWLRNRAEWVLWMRRYVAINMTSLVVFLVYPMAPPWLAAKEGYLPEGVVRITSRGWADLGLGRFDLVLQGVGNPVAAMPSLHTATAVLVALYGIARLRTPWRWLLIAYPTLMGVALVYFAEHYVIDLIAGGLLAVAVHWGSLRWEQRSRPPVVGPY